MTIKIKTQNGLALPVWESFTTEGFIDILKSHLDALRKMTDEIATIPAPTFYDVVVHTEELNETINLEYAVLTHLGSVAMKQYNGIDIIEEEATKLLSNFSSDMLFHTGLYKAFLFVRDGAEFQTLTLEQQYIVTDAIKAFERNGVGLSLEQQSRLRDLSCKIAELEKKFESNVTRATDAWALPIQDEHRLRGVPESLKQLCATKAKELGLTGFALPLQSVVVNTVLDWADDRELRKEIREAFVARATTGGHHAKDINNTTIIEELVAFRDEAARLLGYSCHAERSIAPKMTSSIGVSGVDEFLDTIAAASLKKSIIEQKEYTQFAKSRLQLDVIEAWDIRYVMRVMKQELCAVDEESVREYFPATKVFAGLVSLIQRLFNCSFREVRDVSVWHPSVRFFEVIDASGALVGAFYTDLIARDGKRGGAWMNNLGSHVNHDGVCSLPVAFLCGNFLAPETPGGEQYLTHDDIQTVFHEMGHVLHHIFSKTAYHETSSMHVEWDAIELPSQLLERWSWDKQTLLDMSCHKKTGETIPEEFVDKIIASKHFGAGANRGGLFGLSMFDWRVHRGGNFTSADIERLFDDSTAKACAPAVHHDARRPHIFTHAFGGGYDAGYFSYFWADALVADVAAAFDEAGRDGEAEVGVRYLREILEAGASRPFIESFRAFRGRNPDPSYMIPYNGLA